MANDKIVYDEEILSEVAKRLKGDLSNSAGELGNKVKKDFSGLNSHGLMQESVARENKNMENMQQYLASTGELFAKSANDMFEFDRTTAEKIEDVHVTQDFDANNSMEVNQFNSFILGKLDGRSVNDGEEAHKFNEIDDSIIAAEGLKDIRGTNSKEEQYDESSSIVGQSILGNISGNQTEEQSYDATSSVRGKSLGNISGNQTVQQDYDDNSVVGRSILGNINNNSATIKQDYDANSTIAAAAQLQAMDATKKTQQVEYNDDSMLAAVQMAAADMMAHTNDKKDDKDEEEIERVRV